MMKKKKNTALMAVFIILLLLSMTTAVLAASDSKFISSAETINRDVFLAGQTLKNDGIIKGDLFAAGQSVITSGSIDGDLLCAARDINVDGTVGGNVRTAGNVLVVSGYIGRSVNFFGNDVSVRKSSVINGNFLAFCASVQIDGKIAGNTRINSDKIILSGEYFGDVDINVDIPDGKHTGESRLTVLPGTKINGKLTYKGVKDADIGSGAQIKEYQWIKPVLQENKSKSDKVMLNIWKFFKLVFTTIVYFLIAAGLFKLFPAVFKRQGDVIGQKPLSVFGVGLIALLAIIAAAVLFIILLMLSIAVLSPAVGLVFGAVIGVVYIVLFTFSTVPVSLWLGNLLLRDRLSVIYRFGIGLAVITFGLFITNMLALLPFVGFLFSIMSVIVSFTCLVFGIGALLYAIRDMILTVRSAGPLD